MTELKHKILSLVLSVSTALGAIGTGWLTMPVSADTTGTAYSDGQTGGNIYYTVNGSEVTITGCDATTTTAVIPETIEGFPVTTIGSYSFGVMFEASPELTNVTIPDTVTTIKEFAFSKCSELTVISISKNLVEIGDSAFMGCSSLSSINVDADNPNYKDINGSLFSKNGQTLIAVANGTEGEYTVPAGVVSIANNAFCGRKNLTAVTISNSVTTIGRSVFDDCTSILSITIMGQLAKTIADYAFYGTTALTDINLEADSSAYASTAAWGQGSTVNLNWNYGSSPTPVNPVAGAMDLTINIDSSYFVNIPQTINVDAADDIAYDIKVYGDVSDEDQVTVTPSATITFSKTGSSDQVTGIAITQAKTSWLGTAIFEATDTTNIDINKASGTVGLGAKADEFTAGEWISTITFAIAFVDN